MSSFEKLAKFLVAEVPLSKLQGIFIPTTASLGNFCGTGCPGNSGDHCGFKCLEARVDAPDVIDREGLLQFTAKDLDEIRNNLPKLRQATAAQVEAQLNRLR